MGSPTDGAEGKENEREASRLAAGTTDPVAGKAALRRVRAPDLLAEVARNASLRVVAQAAVAAIGDESLLLAVAMGARDAIVAKDAARKIRTERTLVALVLSDAPELARLVAVKRLAGPDSLVDVACSERDRTTASAALERLDDRNAIARVRRARSSTRRPASKRSRGSTRAACSPPLPRTTRTHTFGRRRSIASRAHASSPRWPRAAAHADVPAVLGRVCASSRRPRRTAHVRAGRRRREQCASPPCGAIEDQRILTDIAVQGSRVARAPRLRSAAAPRPGVRRDAGQEDPRVGGVREAATRRTCATRRRSRTRANVDVAWQVRKAAIERVDDPALLTKRGRNDGSTPRSASPP